MLEAFVNVLALIFTATVVVIGIALLVMIWQMPPYIVEKVQTWNEYRARRRRHLEAFRSAWRKSA